MSVKRESDGTFSFGHFWKNSLKKLIKIFKNRKIFTTPLCMYLLAAKNLFFNLLISNFWRFLILNFSKLKKRDFAGFIPAGPVPQKF